jgi:flap endonuclease-1
MEVAPAFVQARELFLHHETQPDIELKWRPCQVEELTKFLVDDMGFNPDRVASSIEKLKAAYEANKKPQTRMDSFFAVKENPNKKRKPAPVPAKQPAKKGRGKK